MSAPHTVAPANEGQWALGLVVHAVVLGVPCSDESLVQPEPAQVQSAGKVGRRMPHMPAHAGWTVLLSRINTLHLVVIYLVVASVNDLILVASRAICWSSAWNWPVLSTVVMVFLAWTWRGQAQ